LLFNTSFSQLLLHKKRNVFACWVVVVVCCKLVSDGCCCCCCCHIQQQQKDSRINTTPYMTIQNRRLLTTNSWQREEVDYSSKYLNGWKYNPRNINFFVISIEYHHHHTNSTRVPNN
jgi:hypothetical protein